jgi:iron(III) transport system substrate-binding protein
MSFRSGFLLLVALSSCSPHSEKIPLVVYSPHGKDMLQDFKERFEKVNPNIEVHWLDMGSQDALDRIRTERSNPQADLWWGAPSTLFMRAEKESLLQAYRPSWANEVSAQYKSAHDMWYGDFITPEVIVFNSHLLTNATAPKDWNDLIEPKWKNKIVMRYPLASGTLRIIFSSILASSIEKYGNEDKGWYWLRRLDANTKTYTPDPTELYLMLAREEGEVTLWDMPDVVLQVEKYGYPFGYNFPASGTVIVTDGIAIVKGAKHPDAAKAFYEFVTTRESFEVQAKKFYRIPIRTDIPKDSLPAWIANTHYETMDVNLDEIEQHESEWMKKWDETVKGMNR